MRHLFGSMFVLSLLLSLVVSPAVHAAGLTEAQISAIVSLVTSFGADATTVKNVEASLRGQATGSSPNSNAACPAFARDFSLGAIDAATNGEVSKLQQFLISTGIYPEALVTGYFGPATSRALQRWQAANGIAITTPGSGSFGPKTRAAIQLKCGSKPSATSQGEIFADFGMTFMYPKILERFNTGQKFFAYNGETYLFGATGTYVSDAGQFGKRAFLLCYPQAECISDNLIGSETAVSINGYQFKRLVAQPTGNNMGRIRYLYVDPVKNIVLYEFEFFFGANAFYTTYDAAKAESDAIMASVKITPYNHSNAYQVALNQPPVISSFTGSTALAVNQTGTWTVQVQDPENSTMEYYVSWDETQVYDNPTTGALKTVPTSVVGNPRVPCCTAADERVQSTTFSHAFKTTGTYNIRFSARERDTYRGTTEKTLTVIVGN